MAELRVRLFGPGAVTVDGQAVKLKPLTMAVLIRLIVADGTAVTVDQLYQDCWPPAEFIVGGHKTQVQKRILEIRRAVDPGWSSGSGQGSPVLRTERGRVTAYRLVVDRKTIDAFQFIELAAQARRAAPEDRIGLLEQAISLWTGPPLLDVAGQPWADALVRQLSGLRRSAVQELAQAYERAGRTYDALDVAEELAASSPEDTSLAAWAESLRGQVRTCQGARTCREDFTDLKTAVVVMTGDLFDQDDANLVVGFCDTFDTDTDRNIVISGESTQGMLLRTLYDGDRGHLDKELKAALAHVPKVAVEPRSAKPRGKLTRYPVGTVATLYLATRRVFAVAYSQMGNDLMARSSLSMLRLSLDNLWTAVYRHGQLKPVAMPLTGSSLSRTGASYEELLTMIVRSFLASSSARYLGPELRVVIPHPLFGQIKVSQVLKAVRDDRHYTPERVQGTDPMAETDGSISDAEIRAAAIRVLDYILRLELTQARWDRVDGILAIAVEAAAAGDLAALRAATSQLRAIGPVRVIRIGGTPVGPPPPKVRERVEHARIAVGVAVGTAGDTGEEGGKGNDDDQ